jgi:hypothetical protein
MRDGKGLYEVRKAGAQRSFAWSIHTGMQTWRAMLAKVINALLGLFIGGNSVEVILKVLFEETTTVKMTKD